MYIWWGKNFSDKIKVIVKRSIWRHDIDRWKATCLFYPELEVYRDIVKRNTMHVWWNLVKIHPFLHKYVSAVLSVLMGGQPRFFGCNFERSFCKICSTDEVDTPAHVLFKCETLVEIRDRWWGGVTNTMPPAMASNLNSLDNDMKLKFILSCMNCDNFIPEWMDSLMSISKFVFYMYQGRKLKYDIL